MGLYLPISLQSQYSPSPTDMKTWQLYLYAGPHLIWAAYRGAPILGQGQSDCLSWQSGEKITLLKKKRTVSLAAVAKREYRNKPQNMREERKEREHLLSLTKFILCISCPCALWVPYNKLLHESLASLTWITIITAKKMLNNTVTCWKETSL
jgi:hypothetical protein